MQRNGRQTKRAGRFSITLRGIWYLLLLLAMLGAALFFASKMLFGAALGMLVFAALDIGAAKKQSGRLSGLHAESDAEGFLLSLPAGGGKIFPHAVRLDVSVTNLLTGARQERRLHMRADQPETVCFSGGGCGKYVLESKEIRLCDLLGLCAFRVPDRALRAAAVKQPQAAKTDYDGFGTGMLDLDGSIYDEYRAGFDQSEVFEIRAYRPGDKTAQIHWKLSQKTDTLMLRQGSLPVKNALLLLLEAPQGKKKTEAGGPAQDEAFSARAQRAAAQLFSLSENLAEKGVQHHIGYLTSDAKTLTITEISGRESLTENAGAILSSPLYLGISAAELYIQEKEQWEFSHVLVINDEEIQEM